MIFKNYINGEFRDAVDGEQLDVYCPSTGKIYAQVVSSSSKDVDLAVKSAGMLRNLVKNTNGNSL